MTGATLALSGCFAFDDGEGNRTPSREQIQAALTACKIDGAKIEVAKSTAEPRFAVAMAEQNQSKWDCMEKTSDEAGIEFTAWGRKVKDS